MTEKASKAVRAFRKKWGFEFGFDGSTYYQPTDQPENIFTAKPEGIEVEVCDDLRLYPWDEIDRLIEWMQDAKRAYTQAPGSTLLAKGAPDVWQVEDRRPDDSVGRDRDVAIDRTNSWLWIKGAHGWHPPHAIDFAAPIKFLDKGNGDT